VPVLQFSKAKAMMERIAESKEHTFALQQLWMSLEICACAPDARQFQLWFKFEFETIADAFDATAVWLSKLRNGEQPQAADEKTHADKVRYCSAVMVNMVKQERAVAVNGRFGDGSALPVGWDTFNGQQKRKLIAIHKGGNDE
jgi:hypothetical protein